MAPTKPSKNLIKRLKRSNIRVEDPSGVTYRVPPVKELRDPIERFLPPAGRYYDQSVFESTNDATNRHKKCVLCWNAKAAGRECKGKQCTMCGTKHHHSTGCPRVYASIKWWQGHGHLLRKSAQLRPNPGERAYLIVAGVFKDWKKLEDTVVVNMDHPVVKAFYEGKEAPHASAHLPEKSLSTPAVATAKPSRIPLIIEHEADEADYTNDHDRVGENTPKLTSVKHGDLDSVHDQNANAGIPDKTNDIKDGAQNASVSPEKIDSLLDDLPKDLWRPSSYHEGTRRAAVTPLSIRLALTNAQGFASAQQTDVPKGNEARADLDPRLEARAQSRHTTSASQSSLIRDTPHGYVDSVRQDRRKDDRCGDSFQELLKAREEIRAKDRRIRELEIALHEAEGWTDTVTYQGGQKRSRA